MRSVFLLMCLLTMANLQAGELFRSIDKDGKVHYSDTPLEGSEDFEQLKLGNQSVSNENLPYETRRARENFPVTLYGFPDCGAPCKMGRDLLVKRGIPFTEKSLVMKDDFDTFRKDSGDSRLPALSIGKNWVKGFQPEQWNNELDFAGYPKKVLTYQPPRPVEPPAAPTAK
jgi:hypothetical protein